MQELTLSSGITFVFVFSVALIHWCHDDDDCNCNMIMLVVCKAMPDVGRSLTNSTAFNRIFIVPV